MIRSSRRLVTLWLAAALAGASCSRQPKAEELPETGATLEGTVKYGKEDVRFALIIVQAGGNSATGKIGEDGRYKVENVPLGEVTIGVNTDAGRGDYTSQSMARSQGAGGGPLPKFVGVPERYHAPDTSGITTAVNKGANTYDIVIPR